MQFATVNQQVLTKIHTYITNMYMYLYALFYFGSTFKSLTNQSGQKNQNMSSILLKQLCTNLKYCNSCNTLPPFV